MIIGHKNPLRQLVYLSNWLTIRKMLLNRIAKRTLYRPLPSFAWRIFLERFPPKPAEEMAVAERIRAASLQHRAPANSSAGPSTSGSAKSKKKRARNKGPDPAATAKTKQEKRHASRIEVMQYFTDWLGCDFELEPEIAKGFRWQGVEVTLDLEGARSASLRRLETDTRQTDASDVPAPVSQPGNTSLADLARPPPPWVLRQIAWEVTELAFRVELYELDRRFVPEKGETAVNLRHTLLDRIFPGARHWMAPEMPPPVENLGAKGFRDRVGCLDALRRLMARWPNFPATWRDKALDKTSPESLVTALEADLAGFYCRSAVDVLGRAPVVPCEFPSAPP